MKSRSPQKLAVGENTPKNTPSRHGNLRAPWKPGESGNPAGRPQGSRNKLGEAFIDGLADDFAEHGLQVIQAVREKHPYQYLKIIASLLPKELGDLDDVPLSAPVIILRGRPEGPLPA
jgi:hypothetical protein